MQRSIKVKVIKRGQHRVVLHFMALNRKMPVPIKDFEERVANGLYEVVGGVEKEAEPESDA